MNDDYKKLIYIYMFILHYTNLTDFDRRHLSLQYLTPSQFNLHFLRHEKLRLQVSQILKEQGLREKILVKDYRDNTRCILARF